MYITSYGAAEGVTGSCHLLEIGDRRVLLDCGIFQGGRGQRERNEPPFPFDPSSIDRVIISHAHLDHIGRLPLLWKEGFRGPILSTRATFELARLSLLDSAGVMAHDARRRNRHLKAGQPKVEPLYDEQDVLDLIELWGDWVEYHEVIEVEPGLKATFWDAGHILGSAFIEMELTEGDDTVRFMFSGDLGNINKPIIRDPETAPKADIIMMESTYGNRDHKPFANSVTELEAAIVETMARAGNVVIPAFALERSQELLYVLFEAWKAGRIPEDVRIFLDSPMAIGATRIFERHTDLYDAAALQLTANGDSPFDFDALTYTRPTRESIKINDIRSGAIILAGSGMVTGGRVIHHLRHNLLREECSVVFIGYQAGNTPGRRIVDGADFVTLYGQTIPVEAQVYTINGFSAHADQTEMTQWATESGANHIRLVHGEEDVKKEFAEHLRAATGAEVEIAEFGVRRNLLEMAKP